VTPKEQLDQMSSYKVYYDFDKVRNYLKDSGFKATDDNVATFIDKNQSEDPNERNAFDFNFQKTTGQINEMVLDKANRERAVADEVATIVGNNPAAR